MNFPAFIKPSLALTLPLAAICALVQPLEAHADKSGFQPVSLKGANMVDAPVLSPREPMLQPLELPAKDTESPEETDAKTQVPTAPEPLKARAVVVDIDSNTLNYDKEKDVYVATGQVHVIISEQNSELTADKVTYDQNQDLLVAQGKVVITKNGQRTEGSYAKIDLSRQSALINDPVTVIRSVRVKAKTALVDPNYVELEHGKLILNAGLMAQKMSGQPAKKNPASRPTEIVDPSGEDLSTLANGSGTTGKPLGTESLDLNADEGKSSPYKIKAKEIEIRRGEDGYDDINLKWPSLHWGKFKLATMPSGDLSYDEFTKQTTYLGPDIGLDPDYGGFYLGPGWDFRLGQGTVRFSPIASFGGGGRRTRGGAKFEETGIGPGLGGIVHYRSQNAKLDFGYNSRVGQPVLLGETKFLTERTKFQVGMNEDYTNGFLGYERPNYIAQITDYRRVGQWKNMELSTFESIGVARDEFFPTNNDQFFVESKSSEPITAGRVQLQAQLQNVKPLLQVGNFLDFGFRGHVALAGYTTGDFVGLLRAGPSMNVRIGDRFRSSMRYYMAATAGETPFVFDSYYRGRQNLVMNNSFRINNFLTIGTRNDFNLLRDNAQKSLAVGNAFYMLVGPKDVKFNIAYDFIRKRSYFGINFFPGAGNTSVDFERMRMFQPENFSNPMVP